MYINIGFTVLPLGWNFSMAVLHSGEVFAWGSGTNGQCGTSFSSDQRPAERKQRLCSKATEYSRRYSVIESYRDQLDVITYEALLYESMTIDIKSSILTIKILINLCCRNKEKVKYVYS